MYDVLFKQKKIENNKKKLPSNFNLENVNKISLLNWEEHCIECAAPSCYTSCSLYEKREDLKCVRIKNGLVRDYNYNGLFNYGISCEFRKWGKLETVISPIMLSKMQLNLIITLDSLFSNLIYLFSKSIKIFLPDFKILRGYVFIKNKIFSKIKYKTDKIKPDYFILECYSNEKYEIKLLIQVNTNKKILFSEIRTIQNGCNSFLIPYNNFNISYLEETRIFVSPINSTPKIIFTWLDLVSVDKKFNFINYDNIKISEKIKCVAWDLDNTLWDGVLIEDGVENLKVNYNAINIIKNLDERGIINTIVSKNTYDEVIPFLHKLNIFDYFVYPAINWGQKSENLKQIANKLNIGLDTIVFIDDNIREREEVKINLPMVRVFDDKQIDFILDLPEFDVPITEMSKVRRLSYLIEEKRDELREKYSNNYNEYIKNLNIILNLSKIDSEEKKLRCYELLSRSNQLNLSTNRYTLNEYEGLLNSNSHICLCFYSEDKFGDYGLIGFLSAKIENNSFNIIDFVISCRVAKKKIENAMITSLLGIINSLKLKKLNAVLKITSKNKPISDVFNDLPFSRNLIDENTILYSINDLSLLLDEGLIKINYKFDL